MKKWAWLLFVVLICCDPQKKSNKTEKPTKQTKGEKKNGLVKSFESDGKLYSAITYKDDVKHGVAYSYYKNGQVSLELTYENGKRVGTSRRYFENGQLYQTTEYKNNLMHGYQKKYYADGKPQSVARFEEDEPCIGLAEFTTENKERKKFPAIIITTIDELKTKGKYTIRVSLSDKGKNVKFFEGALSPTGCLHNRLHFLSTSSSGVGEMTFNLPPGGFLMEELNFIAKVKTRQGNYFLTQSKYNLALDN